MDLNCLRCSTLLVDDYQLIFDETGIELQLDKLLAENFGISIEKDETKTQALCEECVNKLIELYDLGQKNQELQLPGVEAVHFKEANTLSKNEVIVEESQDNSDDELGEMIKEINALDNDADEDIGNEIEENLSTFENVQHLDEFEGITTQNYVRDVIKSELQEITFEQNTVCRLCSEVLKSHTAVLMHVSTNHETISKKYPCIICDNADDFDSIKDLAFHVVLKHYDLELITIYCMCPECGKRFSTFFEYNKHSCYKPTTASRLLQECETCSKKFTSNKRYRFHLQFHLEKRRPKACLVCDILFSDENDFFEHIMYAHEKEDALICKKCDRICTTQELYDTHMALHNAVRSYHCKHCSKSYLYKQMLTNHIQRHHSQKHENQCKICKKSLASKHLLTRHMQIIHLQETEETVFVCSICGLVGDSEEDAKSHIEEACPDAELSKECLKIAFACEFCEDAYNNVENLKAHRTIHVNKRFICWLCKSEYSEYKKLKTHVITHNKFDSSLKAYPKPFPINRHYVCNVDSCDQTYLTWPSLRAHKGRHAADAKFACEVCTQSFRTRTQLITHMKAHENNEEYPCQFCSKLCLSQMSLAVHIARKHNNNCISCPTCNATYNNEEALKEHVETSHIELKCEFCDKVTKNKRNLEIHVRMIHTKVKRFFCATCNKGYYNKSDLKVHEKAAHSEPNKFKCQHCVFTTSYESSFNAHLLKHEAIKPFKCEVCSRDFTRKTCFKLHMLRHSDVKPFTCPIENCSRSFVTRGILNTHLRDNHPENGTKVKAVSSPRPEKRKRFNAEKVNKHPEKVKCTRKQPVKYVIMEVGSGEPPLKIEDEDGGLVFLEESNAGQEIVLECTEDDNDLIVELNQSELTEEYTVDQY